MHSTVYDNNRNKLEDILFKDALATYAAEILSYWTKELNCSTSALLFLYIMEDQYKLAKINGAILPSQKYTTRALEARSGISKSTVNRKLKKLEQFGLIKIKNSNIVIAEDNNGSLVLSAKLPYGTKINARAVKNLKDTLNT